MTRLTYLKLNAHLLVVDRLVLCGTKPVCIVINSDTLIYRIQDTDNGDVLASGTGASLTDAKVKVKRLLKELGATFYDEVRNRGQFEKLYTKN